MRVVHGGAGRRQGVAQEAANAAHVRAQAARGLPAGVLCATVLGKDVSSIRYGRCAGGERPPVVTVCPSGSDLIGGTGVTVLTAVPVPLLVPGCACLPCTASDGVWACRTVLLLQPTAQASPGAFLPSNRAVLQAPPRHLYIILDLQERTLTTRACTANTLPTSRAAPASF